MTAAYPSGGFFGFYLQTEGTGGSVDPATRTTSDGIFVYQGNIPETVAPGDHLQVTGTVGEPPSGADHAHQLIPTSAVS